MPEPYPYGYRYQLVPHPGEMVIVEMIGNLHFDEGYSQQQIADRLNEQGHTCRGLPWNQRTISRIIRREFSGRRPKAPMTWRQRLRRKEQEGGGP